MTRTLFVLLCLFSLAVLGQSITETFNASSWRPSSAHADFNADGSTTVTVCGSVTGDQGTVRAGCSSAVAAPGSTTGNRLSQVATAFQGRVLAAQGFGTDAGVVLP